MRDRSIQRDLVSKSTATGGHTRFELCTEDKTVSNDDGFTSGISESGSILWIEYPGNFSTSYSYTCKGKLMRIRFPDGRSWLKGIKNWYLASATGEFLQQLRGKPSLDPQGKLWFKGRDGIVRRIDSVKLVEQVATLQVQQPAPLTY